MTATDKRHAMVRDLCNLIDSEMQSCGGMAQGLRYLGSDESAKYWFDKQAKYSAIRFMVEAVLLEYESGQTGKYGIPRSVTNIISAGESAYPREKKT